MLETIRVDPLHKIYIVYTGLGLLFFFQMISKKLIILLKYFNKLK